MGQVSRYVIARYRTPHPDKSPEGFVDFLLHLGEQWRDSVLMPSDDATVIPTSKHRIALQEYFKVVANDWSITEKYIVKKHTYALAEQNGVPCPRTLVPSSLDEAAGFVRSIGFPSLLKPCVGHRFFELFRKKMIVLRDHKDLEQAYRLAETAGVEMMVQELIPGDDNHGANYNSFFRNGHAVCEFTADKVRLSPPGIGFPRVVVSRTIPEVCESGRKMLGALKYNGFSCIEFKRDERDGVYKLMEVNGRQNLSSALAVKCGMDFPYMTYCHALDGSVPAPSTIFKEGVFWIDLERDAIQSLISHRREGLSWREYARPYRNEHVLAVWSFRDPAPFLKRMGDAVVRGPGHALTRIRARLAGGSK
jgi:predicted ATP-grasp superfamily ATP-dependent carboligase